MPSFLYNVAKEDFINGDIDMDLDTIRVRACADEDYASPVATDSSMTPAVAYTGSTDVALSSRTITNGVFDAANLAPAFSSLAIDGSKDIDALVIYKFVTNDADSVPIAYIDLSSAVTPNGGDINITWNASGIFTL